MKTGHLSIVSAMRKCSEVDAPFATLLSLPTIYSSKACMSRYVNIAKQQVGFSYQIISPYSRETSYLLRTYIERHSLQLARKPHLLAEWGLFLYRY